MNSLLRTTITLLISFTVLIVSVGCGSSEVATLVSPDSSQSGVSVAEESISLATEPTFDVQSTTSARGMNLYWGDPHVHSDVSDDMERIEGIEARPADVFIYARDIAALDFVALTDHAEWTTLPEWEEVKTATEAFNQDGTFVTLPAFEWTSPQFGHRNFYLLEPDLLTIPPGAVEFQDGDQNPFLLPNFDQLIAYLSGRGITYFGGPHHPAVNGSNVLRPVDWNAISGRQTFVEIYSKHGNSECSPGEGPACIEPVENSVSSSTVRAGLLRWLDTGDNGYKLGMSGGTDDHFGRPGCVQETLGCFFNNKNVFLPVTGGLTGVYTRQLTRSSIFNAFANRHIYATTGPRIHLEFDALASGSRYMMGDTIPSNSETPVEIQFFGRAIGETAQINQVELLENEEVIETVRPRSSDGLMVFTKVTPSTNSFYRVRAFQRDTLRVDGVLAPERAWSSPIWVELS